MSEVRGLEMIASTWEHFADEMRKAGQWFDGDLVAMGIADDVVKMVPNDVVEMFAVVPAMYDVINKVLVLVTSSEQGFKNVGVISELVGRSVELKMADESVVRLAAQVYYGVNLASALAEKKELLEVLVEKKDSEVSEAERSPLVGMVERMIFAAISQGVSDVHLLPNSTGIEVEFRTDGHLKGISNRFVFTAKERLTVVNILKTKCTPKLESAKQNQPDDGSFKIKFGDSWVDIRVSTTPVVFGQKVVLRLLPGDKSIRQLDKLGYLEEDLKGIRKALLSTSGIFLAVGPTGAGKSTTLYAQIYDILDHSDEPLNVITIEDPIEYRDEKFCQIQVRMAGTEKLSLTARDIFKACLRQDPDLFLFGEIREREDALLAIEAGTTGHRVFSTVHAKDCMAAIDRLLDLQVPEGSLLRELNLIVSQRLVSLLCPECSIDHTTKLDDSVLLTEEEVAILNRYGKVRKRRVVGERSECPHCNDGYKGRTAVAEYLVFDLAFRDFLRKKPSLLAVQDEIRRRGFRSMWDKGLDLVAEGRVDLDEIIRVIGK